MGEGQEIWRATNFSIIGPYRVPHLSSSGSTGSEDPGPLWVTIGEEDLAICMMVYRVLCLGTCYHSDLGCRTHPSPARSMMQIPSVLDSWVAPLRSPPLFSASPGTWPSRNNSVELKCLPGVYSFSALLHAFYLIRGS